MAEIRYYLAEKVGTGTQADPFRPKDMDLYPPGSPFLDFGEKAVMLVQVDAEPAAHDALAVDAVVVAGGKALDTTALSAALAKAGVDTSWISPTVAVADVVSVLKLEGETANLAQGLAGYQAIVTQYETDLLPAKQTALTDLKTEVESK